jgi:probable F420-dependent oxidoreductase
VKYGVSVRAVADGAAWRDDVRRLDDLGFDAIRVADHIGLIDPFTALGAAASVSDRLELATYACNVGFWNPLVLARSAATLALVSDGRFTLGIGAGHAEVEHRAAGLPYPPPGERVSMLERVVPLLRRLLDGKTVDDAVLGMHEAAVGFAFPHVPLLVGGNGDRVLALAGRHADAAGLVGFTSGTGQVHTDRSHWSWEGLADRIAHVRRAAAERAADLTIDILVQRVKVTDAPGDDTPFVLLGTVERIRDQISRLEGLGVDGITVFESSADALAQVLR